MWVADIFDTAGLYYVFVSLPNPKITLALYYLLLHNRKPCTHKNKLHTWAVNNFSPLDMALQSTVS